MIDLAITPRKQIHLSLAHNDPEAIRSFSHRLIALYVSTVRIYLHLFPIKLREMREAHTAHLIRLRNAATSCIFSFRSPYVGIPPALRARISKFSINHSSATMRSTERVRDTVSDLCMSRVILFIRCLSNHLCFLSSCKRDRKKERERY